MHKLNIQTASIYEIVASNTTPETHQPPKTPHYDTLLPQFVYGVVAVMVIVALSQFSTKLFDGMTKLINSIIKLIEVIIK